VWNINDSEVSTITAAKAAASPFLSLFFLLFPAQQFLAVALVSKSRHANHRVFFLHFSHSRTTLQGTVKGTAR
jgi:hypothetical protein